MTNLLYLLAPSLLLVLFTLRARVESRRGVDPVGMACVLHVVGGLVALVFSVGGHGWTALGVGAIEGWAWLGLVAGLVGSLGIIVYFVALSRGPTGPIVTINGLNILIPILVSIVVWGERLSHSQLTGAALTLVALGFLHVGREKSAVPGARGWKWPLIASFLLVGLGNLAYKLKGVYFASAPATSFLTYVYASGALLLAAYSLWTRRVFRREAVVGGAILGTLSVIIMYGLLAALARFSATQVFMTVYGGSPALVVVITAVFMRERYPWPVALATGAGLGGIVLMGMPK